MTCHLSDTKLDPREVYGDDTVDCECNADKACVECIDGELYGTITTTQQGQMPEPPQFIIIPMEGN